MTDHVSAVNSAVEAMDGLLDRLEKLDAITPDLRSALQRLANRSADVAGITLGEQRWDGVVLTDDEAFDSAPVPLIVTDPLGFVIRANVKMLELTETAPGPCWECIPATTYIPTTTTSSPTSGSGCRSRLISTPL